MKNKIYALALSLGMFSPLSCAMECNDEEYINFNDEEYINFNDAEDINFNVDPSFFFKGTKSENSIISENESQNNKNIIHGQDQFDCSDLSPLLRLSLDIINNQEKSDANSKILSTTNSKVSVDDLTSNLNKINLEDNSSKIINNLDNSSVENKDTSNLIESVNYNKNKILDDQSYRSYCGKSSGSKFVDHYGYIKAVDAIGLIQDPRFLKKYRNNAIVGEFRDVLGEMYYNIPLPIVLSRCETNFAKGIKDKNTLEMLKTFSDIYFCSKIKQLNCFHELIMKNVLIHFIEKKIISQFGFSFIDKVYSYDKLINILSLVYYEDQGKNKEKYELSWFGWANTPTKQKSQQLNKKKYLNNHCFIDTTCLENNDFKNQLRLKHRDLKEKWEKAGTLDLTLSPETLQKLHDLLNS